MDDVISRPALQSDWDKFFDGGGSEMSKKQIDKLPGEDSTVTEDSEACKEQKSKLESDTISRQAAIEALTGWQTDPTDEEIVRTLKELPPVEPPKKVVAQIKIDVEEIVERIKEEYEITDRPVCSDCISRQAAIDAVTKYFIDEYDKMPYEYDEEVKDNVFTDMKWVDISLEHNKEIRKVLKSLPPVEPKPVCEDAISKHDLWRIIEDNAYWVTYNETSHEKGMTLTGINQALNECPPVEPKIYGNEHNCIMTIFGECSYSETGCGSCAVVEKVRDALAKAQMKTQNSNENSNEDAISRKVVEEMLMESWVDGFEYQGDLFGGLAKIPSVVPSVEPERPKGEWVDYTEYGYVECPFCHSATNCDGNKDELHFCFSCGADMRGADDE